MRGRNLNRARVRAQLALMDAETWALVDELIKSEGSVPHLYLDTHGLVTVGVGECLELLSEAQGLAFVRRSDGVTASPDEIATDWNAVRACPPGRLAHGYRNSTELELPENDIEWLLLERVAEFESGLERQFEGYDALPALVRMALVDMAFNLGLTGLPEKFPKFCAAIARGDFMTAAAESKRRGVAGRRNAKVRRWLKFAASLPAE